jgi:hypothetical protein
VTFTDDHYYVTFGGGLGELEEWQTGFRCWPVPGNPVANADFLLEQLHTFVSVEDILGDVTALITSISGAVWNSTVTVAWAKVAVINEAGYYAGDAKLAEQAPVGGVGGGGMPWPQLSVAVSLWSGSGFGRANHGRMYLPCPAQVSSHITTGQIDPPAVVDGIRTKMVTLLSDINGEVSTAAVSTIPAIMSKLGTGTTKAIAQVGVGPVMDTMRSRRADLDDEVKTWADAPWDSTLRSLPDRAPTYRQA